MSCMPKHDMFIWHRRCSLAVSLQVVDMCLPSLEQVTHIQPHRIRQRLHVVHSNVALPALDGPHIGAMQPSKLSQGFLADASGQPLGFE